jgi:hypothetical protein
MIEYKYLGDFSATPPWHSVSISCHNCQVSWTGCWDNFQCPQCGDGEEFARITELVYREKGTLVHGNLHMANGSLTQEDIEKATQKAINTPGHCPDPIISHRLYKEIQRIISEGWIYNGQPMEEASGWYYVHGWDSRKR